MRHCKPRFCAIADVACLRSILAQKPWKPSKGSNLRNCSPVMVTSWYEWNNLGQNDKQYTINQSINLRCNCQLVFKVRIKNPYGTKFTIFFQSKSVRSGRTYSGRNSPEEPPSPDLSRLTPEEICILKKVIQRQEEFENEEASCIWWVTTKYIALALRCPCTSLYWCLMNNALPGDSLTNQMAPDQQLSRDLDEY